MHGQQDTYDTVETLELRWLVAADEEPGHVTDDHVDFGGDTICDLYVNTTEHWFVACSRLVGPLTELG